MDNCSFLLVYVDIHLVNLISFLIFLTHMNKDMFVVCEDARSTIAKQDLPALSSDLFSSLFFSDESQSTNLLPKKSPSQCYWSTAVQLGLFSDPSYQFNVNQWSSWTEYVTVSINKWRLCELIFRSRSSCSKRHKSTWSRPYEYERCFLRRK